MNTLDLATIVTSLDGDDAHHLARIMLLLLAFERNEGPAIEGITKLAKLDFLLRYPTYFERAMLARNASKKNLELEEHERKSLESQMVRYRYGPWDHRYRKFLNVLAAKRLVSLESDGRAIMISLTDRGRQHTEALLREETNHKLFDRAKVLRRYLDIGPSDIMKFIYATFPEIASLKFNEAIPE
jgi:hypothetical protein